ncbi:uncharacterized protein V6R79_002794 [Siganus canaliculatus]
MFAPQNFCTLWLLFLLVVSGNATKWNLFKRNPQLREGDLRLTGSQSVSEGRVEIYHNGKWGTVCDDGWDMAEAQVVCRQLRFPGAKSVVTGKDYGQVSGPIWLDDIKCNGTETHLSTCDFKNWGVSDCSHKEDVGVICETHNSNMTIVDSTHSLDHSIGLSEDLGQIFDSGLDCDFLIVAQSSTGDRQEVVDTIICAHKMILSQYSFFSVSKEVNNITVNISYSCQPHFTSFIRYMYTRQMDVTASSVQCVHWMASMFGVRQLKEDAGRLFVKILPEDTLFHTQVSLYEYAKETSDVVLQENCIQYLAWNFQNLTASPAWNSLPVELLGALLSRSDLVVPGEYFLIQMVESWILEKGSSISSETQADLLSHIRFPMIPAEELYELESESSLYILHKNMYREKMFKAFQFNALFFSNLANNSTFYNPDDDFQPRVYTSKPWSIDIEPSRRVQSNPIRTQYRNQYGYRYNDQYYYPSSSVSQTITEYFNTPVHGSLLFKNEQVRWEARVIRNPSDCSNYGLICNSFPVARLTPQNQLSQKRKVVFHNQLLVMCQDRYICQVQDFKNQLAHVTMNGTHVVAYPCPDDQYSYRFVVRPQYV